MEDDWEFLFHSKLFDIDPREIEETSPYMFGRELATWLAEKLKTAGYEIEGIEPEDWGWFVVIKRRPYSLVVACISAVNRDLIDRLDGVRPAARVLWRVIPTAHQPFYSRLFQKIDIDSEFDKLRRDIKMILDSDREIEFASSEEIEAWDSGVDEIIAERFDQNVEPKPVSRWIAVPVGILMIPILLISIVGSASLLYDNPEGYEVIRPIVGTIMLLLCVWLGMVAFRLISGKSGPHGGLFGPLALRVFAGLFFLLPIGGLFSGWYVDHPFAGPIQAIFYYAASFSMWRLAAHRQSRAASNNTG